MKVNELIQALSKLDSELEVVVSDYDGADHCERFVINIKVANRNQVSFKKRWVGGKLVDNYTPTPKEQFVHLMWH